MRIPRTFISGLGRSFAAFLMLFSFAVSSYAQTDVTSSRISGTVSDSSGLALPGVTVEGRNQDTGLTVTDVTNESGSYRLFNLPTGLYTLTASLSGFNSVTRPDVRLTLGSTPTVDFTIQLGTVSETITVTSTTPIVEVTNTAASTTIQTEQLKQLPLSGRNFASLVLLTPQTRFDSERGNLSISGQRGINTNVTVDGVDYNNPFFGGTTGGAEGRAPLSLSIESIKEFSVITNGASVEFGRSGGGFVNVVTKGGTNSLKGSLFYYDQPQDLIADFSDGTKPLDQEKTQYGFSLGGPLVHDRFFFFASYDQQGQSKTVPIQASVLNLASVYPALASDPQYIQTRDGDVAFARLDFQMANAHRFMLRGNFTDYNGDNGTSDSQTRSSRTNGLEGLDTKVYVGSYSGQFGSSILNDFNATKVTEDTPREDKSPTLPEIRIGGTTLGGVSFLPIFSTTERTGFSDTVSYLAGDHVLKGGLEYNDTSVSQIFKGNWRGVFVFDANKPQDFAAGKWTQYFQFGGLGGLTADDAGSISMTQKELAFFVQDQWFVSRALTVTAGVRVENLDNPDAPVLNQNDLAANGAFALNGEIPDINNQWSPRLGVSWSPLARTVLRSAVGRYHSRTPAILLAQLYSSNGLRGTQYTINAGANGPTDPLAPGWGTNFNPVGVERIDFSKVASPTGLGVFAIDPDYENAYTDRVTFGIDHEFFAETAAGLDFTYAESEQLQRLTDINLQYAGTLAANGLPRYNSTRPNRFYGRITTSVSDARSEYTAVSATFRRRFTRGFRAYAGLTWSTDKDNDSNERNFAGIQAEDVNDLDLNWGYSNRDQRWRGSVNASWDTPWWGMGLSGAFRYSTGSAYTALRGDDANNDGFRNDRPTVDGVHFERNSFRQPDFYTLDLRISKDFSVGPGALSLFAECFNCSDNDNGFVPTSNQTWGTGQTPLASFGTETGVGDPRTVQLAVRYDF